MSETGASSLPPRVVGPDPKESVAAWRCSVSAVHGEGHVGLGRGASETHQGETAVVAVSWSKHTHAQP